MEKLDIQQFQKEEKDMSEDKEKIDDLQKGKLHIFEPGLEAIVMLEN